MTQSSAPLVIRAGTADITPQKPVPLFGRLGRSGNFTSVASRLEANCMLIRSGAGDEAAIIAIDSLYPSQALADAVQAKCAVGGLALAPDALMFVASHTHNAPALDATKPKLGKFAPEYLEFVASRIAERLLALREESAGIASAAHGQSDCKASVFRRRSTFGFDLSKLRFSKRMQMAPRPQVAIDQALKLIVFYNQTGAPAAVLWTWACHAVSEPDAMSISTDFPGALREYMREALGNDHLPILYFPGFSGDIRPASRAFIPLHKSGQWLGIGPRFGKADGASAQRLHSRLKGACDGALGSLTDRISASEMAVSRTRRSLTLSELRSEADGLAPLTCDDWQIGPYTIKAVSSEIASGFTGAANGGDPFTFVTGCAGQVFGYLPTDSQLPEGGYEVEGFAPAFSISGAFHASIEAKISDLIGR